MLVFWDVDTQKDFMTKNGKLPVPNATGIYSNLIYLRDYASRNDICVLGSVDRHFEDDDELKDFPPHCMDGTKGQAKIEITNIKPQTFVRSKVGSFGRYEDYTNDEILIDIKNYKQIIFEKQHTDVFTNRNVIKYLNQLRVAEAVVYGVATEYCVKEAVIGLLKLGIKVYLVTDAIKGIDKNNTNKALKEMKEKGTIFKTTQEIIEGEVNG